MASMEKSILAIVLACLCTLTFTRAQSLEAIQPTAGKAVVIPTIYDEDRFVATPVTADGVKLHLFTDSAGGLFLFADTVEKLNLSVTSFGKGKDGQPIRRAALPIFKSGAAIPALREDDGRLFVAPREPGNRTALYIKYDGMLGQPWFAGRV